MKLPQYLIVNEFSFYAKRHGINDLAKAAQYIDIVQEFSNALNARVPNLKLYNLDEPVSLRKYLINALKTQKRDEAKHKAYIKRLEAQHRAKENTNLHEQVLNDQSDKLKNTNLNEQVLNDQLDKLKNLDLSDEAIDKMSLLLDRADL